MCTPEGWLNVSTALGHYVDAVGLALGRQSALQVSLPMSWLKKNNYVESFTWLIGNGGYFWQKMLYSALTLIYMTVYNFLSAFTFFSTFLYVYSTAIPPHLPGVYPADYTGLPRVTTRAKPGLKINIIRGIFLG